jgi:NADH dehydrogenase
VVVVGAGFAGIEVATEMVARLQAITTSEQPPRVVLVEAQSVIGPDLGPGPRQVIADALDDVGVEVLLDQRVIEVADGVVVLADGSSIESATIIWTAGMRASGLTRQLGGTQDRLGRVPVDEFLRVNQTPSIFAAGDTAAARGPDGHAVLQSCQHAIPLGKFAGHNAAADLLGQPLQPFDPGPYITCLDLGTAGAVVATGWDREVRLTGESAKAMKKAIVESYIYPPVDDPAVMLAFARARPNLPLPL